MPIAKIQLEDGRIARFQVPDGTTPEQVLEFAKTGIPKEPATAAVPQQDLGTLGAIKAGVYSLAKGLRDPLDAGAQMLERGVQALGIDTGKINAALGMPSADQAQANAEAAYKAAWGGQAPAFDPSRMVGNIAATAPLVAAMPGAAAPSLMARAASGAASGAATGALQPVDPQEKDFWAKKGEQASLGALLGAAAPVAVSGVGRVLSPKQVQPEAQRMLDAGVRLTPGQTVGGLVNNLEEKAMSLPIVGSAITEARQRAIEDFNRAAVNEALKPIGKTLPADVSAGKEAIRAANDLIKQAYDDLVPNLGVKVNEPFKNTLGKIIDMSKNMPADRAAQFDGIIKREVFDRLSPNGSMTGESFKEMESALGRIASGYRKSMVGDERNLGNAIDEVLKAARQLQMDSNPNKAAQLTALNSAFANMLRIKDAASRLGTEGGYFTPAQLTAATRALDSSMRKNSFAAGNARMQEFAEAAKASLGNRVPDSGTAGRGALIGGLAGMAAMPASIPVALGAAAAGTAAYTPAGVEAMRALLTARPDLLRQVGGGLLNAAPYTAAAGGSIAGLLN